MSKFQDLLKNVYENEYDLTTQKKFSIPKIYDAKGDLSKRWYIYYSFRNPKDNKLKRQNPIFSEINRFKTIRERRAAAKILCEAVTSILNNGFNPYDDTPNVDEAKIYNVDDAVKFAIELKQNTLKENSFRDFRVRINNFQKWLYDNGFENRYITSVNKKTVINFLNLVLTNTGPKNRNNTRSILSMFFQLLEDNDIIENNFVKKINVLKATPERNKTYTSDQEKNILKYLTENDPLLLLFIKFVSFNYLRPVEIVRLKIKDINIKDKLIYVRAKNKAVKIKIIPEILLLELPNLETLDPESNLFSPTGIGNIWNTNETDKRAYFGKRFKKVKTALGLSIDYGLYSFRHTFITKLYKEFIKNSTPFEAKSKLMLITGHTTMDALDKYLRNIDAVLPDDYSDMIK